MTDYNKLTVANLRAELKERGIPATGLTRKQQLIDKLLEKDAQNAEPLVHEPADAPDVSGDVPSLQGGGAEEEAGAAVLDLGQEDPLQDPIISVEAAAEDDGGDDRGAAAAVEGVGIEVLGQGLEDPLQDAKNPEEAVEDGRQDKRETEVISLQDTQIPQEPAAKADAHEDQGAGPAVDDVEAEVSQGQEHALRDHIAPQEVASRHNEEKEGDAGLEQPNVEAGDAGLGHDAILPQQSLPEPESAIASASETRGQNALNGTVTPTEASIERPPPPMADSFTPRVPQIAIQSRETTIGVTITQSETPPPASATQSVLSTPNAKEIQDDTRKRKRRSLTPPASTPEVANKRMKSNDDPVFHLQNDEMASKMVLDADVTMAEAKMEGGATSAALPETVTDDVMEVMELTVPAHHGVPDEEHEKHAPRSPTAEYPAVETTVVHDEVQEPKSPPSRTRTTPHPRSTPPKAASPETAIKQSQTAKDNRYKELFAGAGRESGRETMPTNKPTSSAIEDEREVAPALHPATSAVYIREFMRPLRADQLKEYLIFLATPPNTSPNSDVLKEFYFDSIRTHCFAILNSLAAASRVRSSMHDRKWPNEGNRKPLWADFVPEEKVKDWINLELDSTVGKGPGKRFEVVYENDADGVRASLQEVNGMGPPRRSVTGPSGAPLGPRNSVSGPRRESSSVLNGRPPTTSKPPASSFVALDQLFKSTTAKPKLYYLPVAKEVAEKRLGELADKTARGTVGRATELDERRRYTFQDGNVIVDAGPEFGYGRGGGAYRGGRGGFAPRGRYRGGRY